jgi:hypothetical protein
MSFYFSLPIFKTIAFSSEVRNTPVLGSDAKLIVFSLGRCVKVDVIEIEPIYEYIRNRACGRRESCNIANRTVRRFIFS